MLAVLLSLALCRAPTAQETAGGQPPAAPATPAVQAAPPAPAPAPLLAFEPKSIEFGEVFYGEVMEGKVKLTNVSGKDVPVAEVKTSCGCTLARLHGPDGAEIAAKPAAHGQPIITLHPDESLTVDVTINPPAAMKGRIEKFLQVLFVDKQQPMEQLPVRAQVALAYQVEPTLVTLGFIRKTGRIERTLQVISNVEGDWEIEGYEAGTEGETLPPGMSIEVLDTEGSNRRVKLVWEGPREVGTATVKVRLRIKGHRIPWAEFATYGTVMSDLTFDNGDPQQPGPLINFDTMVPGEHATRTLTVTNADPAIPYLLKSVEIQSSKPQYFKAEIRTLEEGVSYAVDVTCDSQIAEDFFRGKLVLHASHPEEPAKAINFYGRVAPG